MLEPLRSMLEPQPKAFCNLCEDPQASPGWCHYHPGRPIPIFQTFLNEGERDAWQWSCCGEYVPPSDDRGLPLRVPPEIQGELRTLIESVDVELSTSNPVRTKESPCSYRPHKFDCRVAIISDRDIPPQLALPGLRTIIIPLSEFLQDL